MPRIKNLQQLRAGLGDAANDYSDEELLHALSASTGIPLPQAAERFGYDEAKGPWREKASSGIDAYQAGLYGVGEAVAGAVGADGVESFMGRRRRANQISSDISGQRAKQGGIPDSYHDVDGIGSAARYVGGLALDSAPYVAEAAVGGVLGRMMVGGAEAGVAASRAGSTAGATALSYPSSVGDILQNQREQAGQTNLGAAAALGVPYAALNGAIGVEGLAARARLPEHVFGGFLDNVKGVKGGVARATATGAGLAVSEGASETGQEVMNQLGRMAVDPRATLTDPNAIERYKESFVGGAVLGGAFGAGAGGWRRSSSALEPVPDNIAPPAAPVNLLTYSPDPLVAMPDGTVARRSEIDALQNLRGVPEGPYTSMVNQPAAPAAPGPMAPYDAAFAQGGPRGGLQMPGVAYGPVDLLSLADDQQAPNYGGLDFPRPGIDTGGLSAQQSPFPPGAAYPEPNISTEGLSYEGQPGVQPPVPYGPAGQDLSLVPMGQEQQASPQGIPFEYDTGNLALAPNAPTSPAAVSGAQGAPMARPVLDAPTGGVTPRTITPPLPMQAQPGMAAQLGTAGAAQAPQGAQPPSAQRPAVEDGSRTAGQMPSQLPAGAGTPEAAARLAQTQKVTTDANEMIQRAKAAGMESDKQQTSFWRAEALNKEGKLDEGGMTQVVALLMQQKYGKAEKILDEASQAATAPEASTESPESATSAPAMEDVEITGVGKGPATGATPEQAAPASKSAPTIGDAASASPQSLAQRVKLQADREAKAKRYEALLACLHRK